MPNNQTSRCWRCEEIFSSALLATYDGERYCTDCLSIVTDQENYDSDGDSDYDNSNSSAIQSWDSKPNARFHNDNGTVTTVPVTNNLYNKPTLYFGMELETERKQSNIPTYTAARRFIDATDRLVYCKSDMSLRDGFEIVTHPMSFQYVVNHFDNYGTALQSLRSSKYRAWDTSSCGLHIHISKNSFLSVAHEMKFIYMIYKNEKPISDFVGRNSSFAEYNLDAFLGEYNWNIKKPSVTEVVKGLDKHGNPIHRQDGRNLALNRNNQHTHELRIFRPSLQITTVRSYIEFVDCLWHYAKDVTANDCLKNNALTNFTRFVEYARSTPKYPNLMTRLADPNRYKGQ